MKIPEHFFPQAAAGGDEKAAQPYWNNPNYIAQTKLDGARYILHKANGRVRIYSRHISATSGKPVDKTLQLAHIAEEFNKIVPDGTVLDGEVCARGMSSSNLVTKVTGAKPDKALQVQREHGFLEFWAFDCLAYAGDMLTCEPFLGRYDALKEILHGDRVGYVNILPITVHDKRALYDLVVRNGGEGVILKDINAPYYQGDRHKSWIKVKKQKTFDVVFMGIELAKETTFKKGSDVATDSRIKGKAGAIKFGQYVPTEDVKPVEGTLFFGVNKPEGSYTLKELGTVSGFDDATRDDITANASVYTEQQRVFEVTAQEQFRKSGALRHPRFVRWRDDKNAVDCVFRKDEG